MTNDEIVKMIEKLSYHVSILGSIIDHEKHPVEALIVQMDWTKDDINTAHDIFERWDERLEKGEKMSSGQFEGDFNRELSIGYQELKSVILAFYQNYQWTNVCEAYVDSFGKHPAVEYHSIMRRER
ncbi:DUF1878 family protein [Rhizobium leguminosarum]|uniref:DUF1878 family protein n=1 Tax=Rhizobium leguminosarum TaxID=384 RepID=UPI003F9A316A